MIFETHAHYDDDRFKDDRDETIKRVHEKGVAPIINVGASIGSTMTTMELAKKYDFIYAAVGVHPSDIADLNEETFAWLREQTAWERTVAVGEIGLIVYIVLIIAFAYFYTNITFNPLEIANNMKRSGGFIPGIRPGKPTSDYLNQILNYIVFIGAIGLAFIAFVPIFFNGVFNADVSFGGTSIIIIVGVVIETLKQIESQMRVRYYKGFLDD